MADKKLFWINKKGVFGTGKDRKVYGDVITVDNVGGEDRLKKFIKDGKIGQILSPVEKDNVGEINALKDELKALKENAKKQLDDVKKEYEDKIEALKSEMATSKKAAK